VLLLGSPDFTTLALTVLGGGGLAAIINSFLLRSQRENIISQAAERMIRVTEEDNERLRERIARQDRELERCHDRIKELSAKEQDLEERIASLEGTRSNDRRNQE
jgi:predicted RNase H-like nuclease (RuvC/YqgF family)